MRLRAWITQDRACNVEGKSRVILMWFRLAQLCRAGSTPLPRVLERVVDRSYRTLTTWFLATEIHPAVVAGPGLTIYHCHSIVLNPGARLGSRCILRSGVVLGNVVRGGAESAAPRLGDDVDVGVGALIIGDITIGDRVRIGAGAVVVRDVQAGATVVGNPAKVIHVDDRAR